MTHTLTSPAAVGLLRAIVEDPSDDVPRLLLADVLEEAGDPRGEFIRVQCELAQMDAPWCKTEARENNCEELGLTTLCDWCSLRRRERELINLHGNTVLGELPPHYCWSVGDWTVGQGFYWWIYTREGPNQVAKAYTRRGFVASVTLTCADWCGAECRHCNGSGSTRPMTMIGVSQIVTCSACHGTGRTGRHGPTLVLAAPIEEVTLTDKNPYFDPVGCEGVPDWRWVSTVGWSVSCTLPKDLHRLVWDQQKHKSLGCVGISCFPNEESALFALSRAALRWARQEAGLPPLRP